MTRTTVIGIAAVLAVTAVISAMRWQSSRNIARAGFWFEDVTCELARPALIGGPLTREECALIETTAWAALRQAFDGLQVAFAPDRDAFYRVAVVQAKSPDVSMFRGAPAAAGQSRVFSPFGGRGTVNFMVVSSGAIHAAPPGATRRDIVEGIGRGVGRVAAHEFAHQMLPGFPLDSSDDKASYEYESAYGTAQFYGEMKWSRAWPELVKRLGGARSPESNRQ